MQSQEFYNPDFTSILEKITPLYLSEANVEIDSLESLVSDLESQIAELED